MTQYFDPRVWAAPSVSAPPPRAVPRAAPVPNAVYWDRATAKRSRFPDAAELRAEFEKISPPYRKTLDLLASTSGSPAFDLYSRQVGGQFTPRCSSCGALGGDEAPEHRGSCVILREWRYPFDHPWLKRRRRDTEEPEAVEDDEFPF